MLQRVAVHSSALQCVAVRCSVLQCVAVCCSVLQCVAVCCSVLPCVAVPGRKRQRRQRRKAVMIETLTNILNSQLSFSIYRQKDHRADL